MKVWLPYADSVAAMGGVPDGVEVDVWDGHGEPPESARDVELWVPPYMGAGPVVGRVIDRLPSLRVVQTLTAGVDDVRPRIPEGVVLCNAKGVHDASTAELVLGLILASQRGLDDFARAMPEGRWAHGRRPALADKTVLILGYGSVGAAVEARLAGFDVAMVLRVARRQRDGVASYDALPGLLPRADVVVVTVPMTADTRGLVDAEFLGRMRRGALLVNVARGPVVDTDALVAAAAAGQVRAALDVTDPEPLPADHPLWRTRGVLISPHVGGNTDAFLPRAYRLLAEQLRRFAAGEPLLNVVSGDY